MRVKFWGTRGSIPTPEPSAIRYGGDTSCVEVRAGKTVLVLDAGTGMRKLGGALLRDTDWDSKVHVLLSHTHWDHIQGFPFFAPIFQKGTEISVYGAFRVDFRLDECLEGQMSNLYFPVKFKELPSTFKFVEMIEETIEIGDVRVTTRSLNHPQGCFGYRIDDGRHVVVYATDTEPPESGPNEKLIELCQGADLVIHDAQYTPEEYVRAKKGWGHSTWKDAVSTVLAAQAKQLVLFHHDPYHDDDDVDAMLRDAQSFFPSTIAASRELVVQLDEVAPTASQRLLTRSTIARPSEQAIKLAYTEVGPTIVFHVPDDLSLFNSQKFAQAICTTIGPMHRKIVLNMTRLTHMDSAGVGSLASIYSFAKKQSVELCISHLSRQIREVLEVTRFTGLIRIFASDEEAMG